jgi:hypothetical protein
MTLPKRVILDTHKKKKENIFLTEKNLANALYRSVGALTD